MSELSKKIKSQLVHYDDEIKEICEEIVIFAQKMPEVAVKQHLDQLIRKMVKNEETKS